MEMPSFLHSKQTTNPDYSSGDRKKKFGILVLAVLIFAIPLTVWLAQRAQIFNPSAAGGAIELVSGADSCVVSTDPNKVSCAAFPIKLTSPLGPPTQLVSCTADNQCPAGNKCFNYQNYSGTCKPADTVCAQVVTRACLLYPNCNPGDSTCIESEPACVDFPTPCHVPPGWTVERGNRSAAPSPTPALSPSPSAVVVASPSPSASPSTAPTCTTTALSKVPTVNNSTTISYTYTYPATTKIMSVNFTAQPGIRYWMNNQSNASGQGLSVNLGAGVSSFSFAVISDVACGAFTAPFTMVNSCGTSMSDFVGVGSASGYGAVCQGVNEPGPSVSASKAPTASPGSTTGVSSGTDTLGVNLQSQGWCQNGFPIVLFSNQGRSDTNNFKLYRNGSPLSYTFAGTMTRPPITQMKDTGLNLNTSYSYYIQAVDGPLAGQRSNTSTVTTPSNCPVAGFNFLQRWSDKLIRKAEAQSNQASSVAEGLISYWKFDEASGGVAVDSKGVSNGVVTNATVVDGKVNKARQIAATNSKIVVPDVTAYATDFFTVAGWVKPQSFGVDNFVSIFSRRNAANNQGVTLEYSGYQDAGQGQLQCVVFLNGELFNEIRVANTNPYKLNLNQWNHVACSYDGNAVKVYINGTLAGTANKAGVMRNGPGMEIKIGQNLVDSTKSLNGTVDELAYWNRALTQAEITALSTNSLPDGSQEGPSPAPTAQACNVGGANTCPANYFCESICPNGTCDSQNGYCKLSPSQQPSSTPNLPGTSFYKVAETEAGLAGAILLPYTSHVQIHNFAFSSGTPGVRQIWAEFIGANGTTRKEHISVEIIDPSPQITSLDCSLDISKQNLKVTLNGARFGNGNGKITVDGKDAQILSWGANQITASIKPQGSLDDGKLFKIQATMSDSKILPEVSCQVGTTLISLGARLFCREPGKFDLNGVKVTLVDDGGNKVEEEVTVDTAGVIKNLKTKLQVGKLYVISVKAPYSLRKNALFTAASGTNVISPADGKPFILPVGDIAPVILQDGKINTLDRSEIVRQWSILGTTTKTADFNRDTKVKSIDWACMRYDFNAEDEAIPDRAELASPSPVPSFAPSASVGSSPAASVSVSPSPQASTGRSAFFLIELVEPMEGGRYNLEDEFIADIKISSAVEAANLFSAKISFDPTRLEVSRIEKGTVLTSWAEEAFNNTAGTLALTAGLPNPGLKTAGDATPTMARVIFKSKRMGVANITITNDSKIFSNANNADILKEYMSQAVEIVVQ